jgi:hypothetical protein
MNVRYGEPADVRHDSYQYQYDSDNFKDRSSFVAHVYSLQLDQGEKLSNRYGFMIPFRSMAKRQVVEFEDASAWAHILPRYRNPWR